MSGNGTDDHLSILKAKATSANTDTQCKMPNSTRSKDKLSKKSFKKKEEEKRRIGSYLKILQKRFLRLVPYEWIF